MHLAMWSEKTLAVCSVVKPVAEGIRISPKYAIVSTKLHYTLFIARGNPMERWPSVMKAVFCINFG